MKTREEEERDNFEILLKAAGNDPKKLAAVVRDMLVRDKLAEPLPKKQTDKK